MLRMFYKINYSNFEKWIHILLFQVLMTRFNDWLGWFYPGYSVFHLLTRKWNRSKKETRLKRLSVFKACALPWRNLLKNLIWLKKFCETPKRLLYEICETPERCLKDSQLLRHSWKIPETQIEMYFYSYLMITCSQFIVNSHIGRLRRPLIDVQNDISLAGVNCLEWHVRNDTIYYLKRIFI